MLVCASGGLPLVITPKCCFPPFTPSHRIGGCVPYTVPVSPTYRYTRFLTYRSANLSSYPLIGGVREFWAVKSSTGERSFKDLYEIIFIF